MISSFWAWSLLALFSALAFYFMVGYPLLLWKWPFSRLAVAKDLLHTPSVSVLMAVHNGEAWLDDKLATLLALDYPGDKLEIHVLSDASTDGTEAIARNYAHRSVILHSLPRNGKAGALNHGLSVAQGEILFFTDVRQKLHPQALRHLVANFADRRTGAVTGELRIHSAAGAEGEQASMDLYWRYELWARAKQSAQYSLFNTTGCLYAMRRDLARPLPPQTLIDDAEFRYRLIWRGTGFCLIRQVLPTTIRLRRGQNGAAECGRWAGCGRSLPDIRACCSCHTRCGCTLCRISLAGSCCRGV